MQVVLRRKGIAFRASWDGEAKPSDRAAQRWLRIAPTQELVKKTAHTAVFRNQTWLYWDSVSSKETLITTRTERPLGLVTTSDSMLQGVFVTPYASTVRNTFQLGSDSLRNPQALVSAKTEHPDELQLAPQVAKGAVVAVRQKTRTIQLLWLSAVLRMQSVGAQVGSAGSAGLRLKTLVTTGCTAGGHAANTSGLRLQPYTGQEGVGEVFGGQPVENITLRLPLPDGALFAEESVEAPSTGGIGILSACRAAITGRLRSLGSGPDALASWGLQFDGGPAGGRAFASLATRGGVTYRVGLLGRVGLGG